MGLGAQLPDRVPVRVLVLAAVGYAGLAMSITLLFLGMRVVMDIGGSCAEGGPYVVSQSCPDAAVPSVLGGTFGMLLFGALAMVFGSRLGGRWGAVPFLGWVALFGSLGWNFLDYGLFNPPEGSGIDLGWVVCGVVFWIMAFGPLLLALPFAGFVPLGGRPAATRTSPARAPNEPTRPPQVSSAGRVELAGIATAFQAAVMQAEAVTPVAPEARAGPIVGGAAGETAGEEFSEGTQALLDRLERLADMCDRGLLDPGEYEAAKTAIMRELEARS